MAKLRRKTKLELPPRSFRDVVDIWETRDAMARDVGASGDTVRKWWQRDSIPPAWWAAVIKALPRDAVTLEVLWSISERKRSQAT